MEVAWAGPLTFRWALPVLKRPEGWAHRPLEARLFRNAGVAHQLGRATWVDKVKWMGQSRQALLGSTGQEGAGLEPRHGYPAWPFPRAVWRLPQEGKNDHRSCIYKRHKAEELGLREPQGPRLEDTPPSALQNFLLTI